MGMEEKIEKTTPGHILHEETRRHNGESGYKVRKETSRIRRRIDRQIMLGTNKEKRKQNGIRRDEKKILRKKRMFNSGGGEKTRRRRRNMGGDDAERNRHRKVRKQDTNRSEDL